MGIALGNRMGSVRVRGALHVKMAKQVENMLLFVCLHARARYRGLILDIFHVYKAPTLHLFGNCTIECAMSMFRVHGPRSAEEGN